MCGRFYVDEKLQREIDDLVDEIDKDIHDKGGDVYPSENPITIMSLDNRSIETNMSWGFPGYKGRGRIINARSETAFEKSTFSESLKTRRCIIPARGFYEWDKNKHKVYFERDGKEAIFMAGIWRYIGDAKSFVILTTAANKSVLEIHERMPLILERSEINDWISNNSRTDFLLHKSPLELKHTAPGYIQESFL